MKVEVAATLLASAASAAACGGAAHVAVPSAGRGGGVAGPVAAGPPAVDALPSTSALAARGATDAPLMRELLRVEQAAPRSADVRGERDLCVRAVFAASAPVKAWFADQAGAARGEVATATSGTVPPRGPACLKKGESLHLIVEGEGPVSARAVLFAAP